MVIALPPGAAGAGPTATAGEIIHVRDAAGGAILPVSPSRLTPAMLDRLAKGELQRVTADGSPWREPAAAPS